MSLFLDSCECPDVGLLRADPFIVEFFKECVYTYGDKWSFTLGVFSVAVFSFCMLPQVVKNFKSKSTEALSVALLVQWISGDVTNLLGAVLTRQLPTMQLVAWFFCCVDTLLLFQWVYYGREGANVGAAGREDSPTERTALLGADAEDTDAHGRSFLANDDHGLNRLTPRKNKRSIFLSVSIFFATGLFMLFSSSSLSPSSLSSSSSFSSSSFVSSPLSSGARVLLSAGVRVCGSQAGIAGWALHTGNLLGWSSGLLYLSSRIPQIIKNKKDRSVKGLSKWTFVSAVLGNSSYALSILLHSHREMTTGAYLLSTFPWLVGSLGTVLLDIIILLQIKFYSHLALNPAGTTLTRSLSRSPMVGFIFKLPPPTLDPLDI
jgi:uncharacterized protein with PQ loop repeat